MAKAADYKSRAPDDHRDDGVDDADEEGRKTVLEAFFREVHDRDEAKAGRDHRRDGHVRLQRSPGDKEVGDALDRAAGEDAGDDRAGDIEEDDRHVDRMEVHISAHPPIPTNADRNALTI